MITVKKEKLPKCWAGHADYPDVSEEQKNEMYVAWVARDDQVPDFYVAIQPKKGRDAKSLALDMYNEELPGWLERHQ
jgi:hypothetical protein